MAKAVGPRSRARARGSRTRISRSAAVHDDATPTLPSSRAPDGVPSLLARSRGRSDAPSMARPTCGGHPWPPHPARAASLGARRRGPASAQRRRGPRVDQGSAGPRVLARWGWSKRLGSIAACHLATHGLGAVCITPQGPLGACRAPHRNAGWPGPPSQSRDGPARPAEQGRESGRPRVPMRREGSPSAGRAPGEAARCIPHRARRVAVRQSRGTRTELRWTSTSP